MAGDVPITRDRPGPIPSYILVAADIGEHFDGPLPNPDIVATQGCYLLTRPNTPIDGLPATEDELTLERRFERAANIQALRVYKYGEEAAEAWPHRHTPSEYRQAYEDKGKVALAALDDDSDPDPTDCRILQSPESTHHDGYIATPPSSLGDDHPTHKRLPLKHNASEGEGLSVPPTIERPTGDSVRESSQKRVREDGAEVLHEQPLTKRRHNAVPRLSVYAKVKEDTITKHNLREQGMRSRQGSKNMHRIGSGKTRSKNRRTSGARSIERVSKSSYSRAGKPSMDSGKVSNIIQTRGLVVENGRRRSARLRSMVDLSCRCPR